jgi:diphthamide synthase subunit DPH2
LVIEWDVLIVEMSFLAAIIYGAIYVESWVQKRKARKEENEMRKKILVIVTNDLNKQLHFIEESVRDKDFKPFHTTIWDAVILGGKQTLLPFDIFENLQDTYSWMTYYNNELSQNETASEKLLVGLLGDVRRSIVQSLAHLDN